MAVSSLHYTMGISSGFKVYILEGQHNARDTDKLCPFTNHGIPVYPIKRKRSPEPPQFPKRVPPARNQHREKVTSSPVNVKPAMRQRSSVTNTTKSLGPTLSLEHVLKTLIPERHLLEKEILRHHDEQTPLALIKKMEKPTNPMQLQQNRPSVITCVTKPKPAPPPPAENANPLQDGENQFSSRNPDVEEHFHRSLTSFYRHPKPSPLRHAAACPVPPANLSVEDHFSKALGSKWLLVRAAADSPSSPTNRSRTRPL